MVVVDLGNGNVGHVHGRTQKDLYTLLHQESQVGTQVRGGSDASADAQWDISQESAESSAEKEWASYTSPIELASSLGHRLNNARNQQRREAEDEMASKDRQEDREEVQEVLEVILKTVRSPHFLAQQAGSILLDQHRVLDELLQLLLENRGAESDTALLILDTLSHSHDSCRAAVCDVGFLEKVSLRLSRPATRKNRSVFIMLQVKKYPKPVVCIDGACV